MSQRHYNQGVSSQVALQVERGRISWSSGIGVVDAISEFLFAIGFHRNKRKVGNTSDVALKYNLKVSYIQHFKIRE